MKTGYVTGATGCVGRNLVGELINEGWDVVVLHRKSSDLSRLKNIKVRFQEVNLYDLKSVRKSISDNADAIFHVAANTSHWAVEKEEQWKDNVLSTRNLVQVALEKKVKRFIFTSTGATRCFQETDLKQAARIEPPYVRTKRLSELEVYSGMERGLDAVILQPIIVVGAYDYNSYAQIFKDVKNRRIKISFPSKIAFCHAEDVAKAHVQAFEKGRSGESYVLGGPYTTWHEFFQKVANIMGVQGTIHRVPLLLLKTVAHLSALVSYITRKKPVLTPELVKLLGEDDPDISYFDKRKSKEDLGYESRSLDTMVKDCYDWLVKENRIQSKGQQTRSIKSSIGHGRKEKRFPITLPGVSLDKDIKVVNISKQGLGIECDKSILIKLNEGTLRVSIDEGRHLDLNVKPMWNSDKYCGLQIINPPLKWNEFVSSMEN